MYFSSELLHYIYQLHLYLQHQHVKMKEMKTELKQLREAIDQIQANPSPTIEKIEYKFDQLKIETLEGTLNIGLTPTGSDQIDEVIAGQTPYQQGMPPEADALISEIRANVDSYLEREGPKLLERNENRYSQPLSDEYRKLILMDIEKQLDQRIAYYVQQQLATGEAPTNSADYAALVTDRVIEDIEQAVSSFIKHLPKGD